MYTGDSQIELIISREKARQSNLKAYYTGKTCKHGHRDFRRVDNGACMECRRLGKNRWHNEGKVQEDGDKSRPLPSQEFLKECFDYSLELGNLIWNRPRHHFKTERGFKIHVGSKRGKVAGFFNKSTGYTEVRIGNDLYRAHRLIYKLVHGVDPLIVDHINSNRSDNRIENLRSVTSKVNAERAKDTDGNLIKWEIPE